MKHKKRRIILLSIILVLILFFFGLSYFIGEQVFKSTSQLVTNEETTGVGDSFWETYNLDYEEMLRQYRVEKIEVPSTLDGHTIPGDYLYAVDAANKNHDTVILVHGMGGNRYSNYPLAAYFLEQGYNVITYDQRSSGENTAPYTTFGYWEKYDVIDLVQQTAAEAPDKHIGLWGTSMGGATVGLALLDSTVNESVDFAILDCPVSSMEAMLTAEMERMDTGIPIGYMLFCGNVVNNLKLHFSYQDADVPAAVAHTEVPVFIINSEADTLTPDFMGDDIYRAVAHSNKQIWTVPDSEHTEVWLDYNDEYRRRMSGFIEQAIS